MFMLYCNFRIMGAAQAVFLAVTMYSKFVLCVLTSAPDQRSRAFPTSVPAPEPLIPLLHFF
jgi:hypothetical protein